MVHKPKWLTGLQNLYLPAIIADNIYFCKPNTMLNAESRRLLKQQLPIELLATRAWLAAQGFSLHFIDNAVKSQTLTALSAGVYAREASVISWKGVITSLQRMSVQPVHVGGLSALDIEGLAHYQSRGKVAVIQLYSDSAAPAWLDKIQSNANFAWHSTRRIWPETFMHDSKFLREELWHESLPALLYSCPEKAILEVLAEIPKTISFEHVDQLMQGLSNLSPRKIDAVLRASSSIKAKRLFMWLAERHNHSWVKHVDLENIDFGKGKRELAQAGRLEKKWNITIPKEM